MAVVLSGQGPEPNVCQSPGGNPFKFPTNGQKLGSKLDMPPVDDLDSKKF